MHPALRLALKAITTVIPDHSYCIALARLARLNAFRAILITKHLLYRRPRLISIVLTAGSIFLYAFYHLSLKSSKLLKKPRVSALEALSQVILPPRDMPWPKLYQDLTRTADRSFCSIRIDIPLEHLLNDLIEGRLELCHPSRHLYLLLSGGIMIAGWFFNVESPPEYRFDLGHNSASQELTKPVNLFAGDHKSALEILTMQSYYHQYSSRNHKRFDGNVYAWPSIDAIPRTHILNFVRTTQAYLHANNTKLSTLTFASRAESTCITYGGHYSMTAVLCDGPQMHSGLSRKRLGYPIPFFTDLDAVSRLLTTGPCAQRILDITDISKNYAYLLDQYAKELEKSTKKKQKFVKELGVRAWREECLHAHWEAALYRGNMLKRWIVLMERIDPASLTDA